MKTNFVDGTIVQPDYLNSIYLSSGGHIHDGGSGDGHAAKIDLQRDVENKLLNTSIFGHYEGNSILRFTGFIGGSNDVVISYMRQGAGGYPIATIVFPKMSDFSNSNLLYTNDSAYYLPEIVRPAESAFCWCIVTNGFNATPGGVRIDPNGAVSFGVYREGVLTFEGWYDTDSNKGWPPLVVQYPLTV